MSVLLSQSYGYYIHIIPELCYEFHVVNVGLIMALLRQHYSHRHQLIIQKIVIYSLILVINFSFCTSVWLHYLQHSRTLFQVLCHRCGIHYVPPSMRLFLLSSTHHTGISLRYKFSTFRSVCLNDIFSCSQHRFTSLTFDR